VFGGNLKEEHDDFKNLGAWGRNHFQLGTTNSFRLPNGGGIYIITSPSIHYIKIGRTGSFFERMKAYSTAIPQVTMRCWPGDPDVENEILSKFNSRCIVGEMFYTTVQSEIEDYLNKRLPITLDSCDY